MESVKAALVQSVKAALVQSAKDVPFQSVDQAFQAFRQAGSRSRTTLAVYAQVHNMVYFQMHAWASLQVSQQLEPHLRREGVSRNG